MYEKYDKYLIDNYNVDFNSYVNSIRNLGNESGIYSDVALLLYELIAHADTKSVLEFGSGMSTVVMAGSCKDNNKKLISIEPIKKWHGITEKCLDEFGFLQSLNYVCTNNDGSRFPVLDEAPSFVWVDGEITEEVGNGYAGRLGACNYYWDSIRDSCLLFDDAQWVANWNWRDWLCEKCRGSDTTILYNPTGRTDRHVLISLPFVNHPYLDVINSCMAL